MHPTHPSPNAPSLLAPPPGRTTAAPAVAAPRPRPPRRHGARGRRSRSPWSQVEWHDAMPGCQATGDGSMIQTVRCPFPSEMNSVSGFKLEPPYTSSWIVSHEFSNRSSWHVLYGSQVVLLLNHFPTPSLNPSCNCLIPFPKKKKHRPKTCSTRSTPS